MLGLGELTMGKSRFGMHGRATITKYIDYDHYLAGRPFAIVETGPNEIMYGGASAVWEILISTWSDATWASPYIGVGDGTGGGKGLNNLTGGNTLKKGMEGGYPEHTDGFGASNAVCKFRSLFLSGEANFHWREWGLFNSSQARMLNHQIQDNGRKRVGMVWDMLTTFEID